MRSVWKIMAFIAVLTPACAADGPKPLFAEDAAINLTISGPFKDLSREKKATPVAGQLKLGGSAPETLPVMLATRGVTRRRADICSFPPLRVSFDPKPEKGSLFRKQKHLKLVTHCQPDDKYAQNVLLEYAAYRMYQVMTPESFRVRLANVRYRDESGREITTQPGFFIEDIDDVAKRNDQERFHINGPIAQAQLDPVAAARFVIFQYMISNLDFAMNAPEVGSDCCHNARLLTVPGATTRLIPVPYDFDMSGLIDAPYAGPPKVVHVASVRDRRYHGFCMHNDQVQPAIADFVAHRDALLAVMDNIPNLSPIARAKAVRYLNGFFEVVADPRKVSDMLEYCLK
jgi:hypothetical protein